MGKSTDCTVLDDPMIRSALRSRLRSSGCIVIDELPIASSSAIADVVTLDTHLTGYEIKSDRDTFRRLPDQMARYSAVFDRIILVTTARHLDRAMTVLPPRAGLLIASGNPVRFRTEVPVLRNPMQRTGALLDLLDDRDLRRIAKAHGLRGYSNLLKFQLVARLVREVPPTRCRAEVLAAMRSRPGWVNQTSLAS